MAAIHYEPGEVLNKKTGSKYIREVPVPTGKDRRAIIECGCCGKHYEAKIQRVKQGRLCFECGSKKSSKSLRQEYHRGQILNRETGSIFLEEIPVEKDKTRRAKILCGGCNKVYEAPIKKVKSGHLCSECGHKKTGEARQKNYEKGQILNDSGSVYIGFDHRNESGELFAKIKCGLCGQIYTASVRKVISGQCCKECRGKRITEARTQYHEGDIIVSKIGTKFKFIKELTQEGQSRRGIFAICLGKDKLSKTFPSTLNSIIQGYANGRVGMSSGEIKFYQSVVEMGYPFQWQVSFDDLVSPVGGKLRYDFSLMVDGELILFELDGEQHFKPVERFGGEQAFYKRKYYDSLKNKYAEEKGIRLIRISYKDYPNISPAFIEDLIFERSDIFG